MAAPALAQVTVVSQDRSVHALWTGGNDTITSPDFSHFVASVGRMDQGAGETGAVATQDSTIAPGLFSYAGQVRAYRGGSLAESLYRVGFTVPASRDFTFDAVVTGGGFFGSGALSAVLTGPGGEVFSGTAFDIPGQSRQIHQAGTLAPGDYVLDLNFSVRGLSTSVEITGNGTAAMNFVPAPSAAGALAVCALFASRRRRR
jgi:hypothetical protein